MGDIRQNNIFAQQKSGKQTENNFDEYTKMAGEPTFIKKGAVSPNGESTPFVWKGRYMRLEKVDDAHGLNPNDPSICAIIRDVETGKITSKFAYGYYYHSGYIENDTYYVLGTALTHETMYCGDTVKIFSSKDLINWDERILFTHKGFTLFNTSLTKSENGYVLAVEIGSPAEWAGQNPFTCMFMTSKDLYEWSVLPKEYTYPKNRYAGGPYLTYDDSYYYLFLVTGLPCDRFNVYVSRTPDFATWEMGKYNPFIYITPEDRQVAPYAADMDEYLLKKISTGFLSSLSDIDMCDLNGKTRICYNVGNQLGYAYICEAEYDGSKSSFLKSLFK